MSKQDWQCITPGCGRARCQGEWCDACSRRAKTNQPQRCSIDACTRQVQHRESGLCHTHHLQRSGNGVLKGIRATGETRWAEGQPQTEMTDGRQTWWVYGSEEAA